MNNSLKNIVNRTYNQPIKTKVWKLVEPRHFEMEEEILHPKDDEVLLKMVSCGICGSDLKVYRGEHPYAKYPRILGHEVCGLTTNKETLETYFPVTISPYKHCGNCLACKQGSYHCCINNETMGVQRNGAHSEYILVKKVGINKDIFDYGLSLFGSSIEESMEEGMDSELLSLVEPFFVSYHAISKVLRNAYHEKIVIFGAGPIGLYCGIVAKEFVKDVYIWDPNKHKMDKAEELGFKRFEYNMAMSTCIEASGNETALKNCFDYISPTGSIILLGHIKNSKYILPHSDIIKKEIKIFGSRNSDLFEIDNIFEAIEFMKENRIDIMKTITRRISFNDIPKYFEELDNKETKDIKCLIKW